MFQFDKHYRIVGAVLQMLGPQNIDVPRCWYVSLLSRWLQQHRVLDTRNIHVIQIWRFVLQYNRRGLQRNGAMTCVY